MSWLSRSLNLNVVGGKWGALRALSLVGICDVKEIKGWGGVPNLVWLQFQDLASLKRITPIGCLKRLERLSVIGCQNLELQALVSSVDRSRSSLAWVGDELPKLQVVDMVDNLHLVEVGSRLPSTFPDLRSLGLRSCHKLETFPDLKLHSLRVLDLSDCRNLKMMEGSSSSLTALEQLNLQSCTNLETVPNLSGLMNLKVHEGGADERGLLLKLYHIRMTSACTHTRLAESWMQGYKSTWRLMHNMTLNHRSSTTNLLSFLKENAVLCGSEQFDRDFQMLSHGDRVEEATIIRMNDRDDRWKFRDSKCEACESSRISTSLPHVVPFIDPLYLMIRYPGLTRLCSSNISGQDFCLLDLGGLKSLKCLHLASFESVKELLSLSSLVNLEELILKDFCNLKVMSGLGMHHTSLFSLQIYDCPLLERISGLDVLPSLSDMHLCNCTSLSFGDPRLQAQEKFTVSAMLQPDAYMRTLITSSMHSLFVWDCPHVASDLRAFTSLRRLTICKCKSLTDVSAVAAMTSLEELELHCCESLRDIPDLTHLTSLSSVSIRIPGPGWTLSKGGLQQMVGD